MAGPYIKHGKTNVGLPEGKSVEDITLSTALELLATKTSSAKSTHKFNQLSAKQRQRPLLRKKPQPAAVLAARLQRVQKSRANTSPNCLDVGWAVHC